MKQSARFIAIFAFCLLAFAFRSPAPLVYQQGEGWVYDSPGVDNGKWQRARAKDQLEVGQAAYEKKNYDVAIKCCNRVEKSWPLSDYAPQAQFLLGQCYEATKQDEKAFNAYQRIIDHNPKAVNYEEILKRQYEIANRYMNGQWFKLWNYIPFFPSMDKTADMYKKIIKSGPYSEIAAQSQLKLGETHEKQDDQEAAVKAYETAADRYHDRPQVAADALFKAGLAYKKQVKSADYDHNLASQSINSLNDFITLYPNEPRVPEAQKLIGELKTEAARGNFTIAEYYENKHKYLGALIYYNEVLVQDANCSYAQTARQRISSLRQKLKLGDDTAAPAPAPAPAPAAETPAPAETPAVEPAAAPASDPATQTPAPAVEIPAPATESAPVAASAPAVSASEPAPVTSATESTSDGTKTNKPSWWSNVRHFKWLPSKPKSQPAPITETPASENTDKK